MMHSCSGCGSRVQTRRASGLYRRKKQCTAYSMIRSTVRRSQTSTADAGLDGAARTITSGQSRSFQARDTAILPRLDGINDGVSATDAMVEGSPAMMWPWRPTRSISETLGLWEERLGRLLSETERLVDEHEKSLEPELISRANRLMWEVRDALVIGDRLTSFVQGKELALHLTIMRDELGLYPVQVPKPARSCAEA